MRFIRDLIKPFNIIQFLLANLAFAFVIIAIFMLSYIENFHEFLFYLSWSYVITFTQWTGAILINYLLDIKIKWIEKPVLRSLLGIFILVLYSVIAFIAVKYLMYYLKYGRFPEDQWQFTAVSSLSAVLISFIISLIFTAIGFFKGWKRAIERERNLKAEMMAYKYESLRNQINPHFLFNSFNVLSDLVYSDQSQAVKFINQLSELFRYVLDSRDKELVPLKDELDFMQSYLYLLKTRFEDKLVLHMDVEAAPDELIVPMTLQLMIENAVKHNEVSAAFPLQIIIRRNTDYLEVENTLRLKQVGDNSKNTGLRNITQQFAYFTDRQIEIDDSGSKFLVRIPILKAAEK